MSLSIHTIKQLPEPDGGWSVGYYGPTSLVIQSGQPSQHVIDWVEICQFKDIQEALHRVNILNGGSGQLFTSD